MPTLTRWFLKTAMLYFLGGFSLGGLLLINVGWKHQARLQALQPVYWHLILVGWLIQLIFGVAFWMFPSFSKVSPHRSEALGWFTYGALNVGLLLRLLIEPWHSLHAEAGLGWLLVLAAILQVAAGWAFVINTWARVRVRSR